MIFFFDYLYMQCCDLYKRNKIERASRSWGGSAVMIVAGSTGLVIAFINTLIFQLLILEHIRDNRELLDDSFFYLKIIFIVVFLLLLLIFGIRYNKYISYEDVVGKVKHLSKIQRIMLDVLVFIYLFTSLPLFLTYAICVGPIV